jgi:hypothetical protein
LTAATARLARITAIWQRAAPVLTSTWLLGAVVAVATWSVVLVTPYTGLDPNWHVGLYMATHDGLLFGTDFIWTYGPLGFLGQPWVVYPGLTAISFLYESALFVALCMSLVWALRRLLNPALALVLAYVALAAATLPPGVEVPLALTAVWCLAALAPAPPRYARHLVAVGGGALGAIECLVKLSVGPTVLLMSAATLLALPTRSRDVLRFAVSAIATFATLWFATGQGVGNLPDYISSARQVVSGYSQAMGVDLEPQWYIFAAAEIMLMLVAWAVVSAAPGPGRVAAGVTMALAAFAAFKEGFVRFDSGHVVGFFATATALTLAIPWRRGLGSAATITLAVAGGLSVYASSVSARDLLDPVPRVTHLGSEVRLVATRVDEVARAARVSLRAGYGLDRRTLALLRDHPVDIAPTDAAVAWAYALDWSPAPVLQAYNAYTTALDRDNAHFLASPPERQRILRAAPTLTGDDPNLIDGRNPVWDPPLANVAMLCHYAPLRTTSRWQVLGKVPDRCQPLHLLRSVDAAYGQTVKIPKAPPGAAVVAKIHGAGVSGLESLRTFLFRSSFRYATVNGASTYRLVPGTAADGLLMSVPKRADFPGPGFSLSPGARQLSLSGTSGTLKIDFYALPIRSLPRSAR